MTRTDAGCLAALEEVGHLDCSTIVAAEVLHKRALECSRKIECDLNTLREGVEKLAKIYDEEAEKFKAQGYERIAQDVVGCATELRALLK